MWKTKKYLAHSAQPHQAFSKESVFVSNKRKENIFCHTSVFFFLSTAHNNVFLSTNVYISMHLRLSSTLEHLKTQREIYSKSIHGMHFLVNVFKSLCFHLSSHKTERFQNASLLKMLTKSLRVHHHLRRSSIDDKQKRNKNYAISN